MLCAAYAEPNRHYHTGQHIRECLLLLDESGLAVRPDEVEYALWLHDVVYDPHRDDNEERSAALAAHWLPDGDGSVSIRIRIRDLILATRHQLPPQSEDEALIQDIDLHILGASPERFASYESQIRKEYAYVPTFIFRKRRRKILEAFLKREHLFHLPWFRDRFEVLARQNIRRSLAGG